MGVENQVNSFNDNNHRLPGDVLNDALSKIDNKGRVTLVDRETGEQFAWPPHPPVALETLPKDVYNHKMLLVARCIHGAIFQIQGFPEMKEKILRNLAISLTAYRHDPEFLTKAASLVKLDERGFLYDPYLPPANPKNL